MDDDRRLSYFFLGLGLGVAAGMLFAPKSGEETRELLRNKASEGKDYLRRRGDEFRESASEYADRMRESAGDYAERGRAVLTRQKDNLSAAMEAGKSAYREAVSGSETSRNSTPAEGI